MGLPCEVAVEVGCFLSPRGVWSLSVVCRQWLEAMERKNLLQDVLRQQETVFKKLAWSNRIRTHILRQVKPVVSPCFVDGDATAAWLRFMQLDVLKSLRCGQVIHDGVVHLKSLQQLQSVDCCGPPSCAAMQLVVQ